MSFDAQIRSDVYSNAMSVSSARDFSGDVQVAIDQEIPAGAVNQSILVALDVSQVRMIVLKSDVAMTIRTNNAGSPANTINLLANVAYEWGQGGYSSLLLTVDVTAFFVSNPGTANGRLQMLAIVDL
jgi:hypothetical protein